MAFIPMVPGISVSITSKGEDLQEHPDTDEIQVDHPDESVREYQAERTVSTYIVAEDGAPFGIKVSLSLLPWIISVQHFILHKTF